MSCKGPSGPAARSSVVGVHDLSWLQLGVRSPPQSLLFGISTQDSTCFLVSTFSYVASKGLPQLCPHLYYCRQAGAQNTLALPVQDLGIPSFFFSLESLLVLLTVWVPCHAQACQGVEWPSCPYPLPWEALTCKRNRETQRTWIRAGFPTFNMSEAAWRRCCRGMERLLPCFLWAYRR